MKILIYTTHRTGSTSLANFLVYHYSDYEYIRNIDINEIKEIDNKVIKFTPNEIPYESIYGLFDKRIILIRENKKEQAESRLYADLVEKKFSDYTIPKEFLENHIKEIENLQLKIEEENSYLKSCKDCLIITYEELFFSYEGIKKLEEYLDIEFHFMLDNRKRYRNGTKTLI